MYAKCAKYELPLLISTMRNSPRPIVDIMEDVVMDRLEVIEVKAARKWMRTQFEQTKGNRSRFDLLQLCRIGDSLLVP